MRHALTSPDYFGSTAMMGGETWAGWRTLLLAIMGEAPDRDRGGAVPRGYRPRNAALQSRSANSGVSWGVVVAKSRAMGTLAAFLSGCVDHRGVLAPGQRGRLPIIAASKDQADEVFNYIVGAFEHSPALKPSDREAPRPDAGAHVQDRHPGPCPQSFRSLRGATNIGVIADEIAYWRSDESANP